jgi:hypothetical protein
MLENTKITPKTCKETKTSKPKFERGQTLIKGFTVVQDQAEGLKYLKKSLPPKPKISEKTAAASPKIKKTIFKPKKSSTPKGPKSENLNENKVDPSEEHDYFKNLENTGQDQQNEP